MQESNAIYRVRRKRVRRTAGDADAADNPVRPHAHNLAEFALHGAKYAFPGVRLPLAVGVPTCHSAPVFAGVFAPGSTDLVWPHPNGTVRGVGVEPMHSAVPTLLDHPSFLNALPGHLSDPEHEVAVVARLKQISS